MLLRPHDQSHRRIFAERAPFLEFLLNHCDRWIVTSALRPDTLHLLPGARITDDEGRVLRQEIFWRIGYGGDTHLVCSVEFQSIRDKNIFHRMREYGYLTLSSLRRSGLLDPNGMPPYYLPVVVYDGPERWDPRCAYGPEGPPYADWMSRVWSPFYLVDVGRIAETESDKDTLLVRLGKEA